MIGVRCTSLAVLGTTRHQCDRDLGHTGPHVYDLRPATVCDACGDVVTDPYRFRHLDCPPPAHIAARIAEIRNRIGAS